jgi:hypothetical protein
VAARAVLVGELYDAGPRRVPLVNGEAAEARAARVVAVNEPRGGVSCAQIGPLDVAITAGEQHAAHRPLAGQHHEA